MPSEVYEYLRLGIELTNKHMALNESFARWPKDRSVVLKVCQPHPEVASYFSNWLKLYAEDQLKEGAVIEEPFNVYLDTSGEKYAIMLHRGVVTEPTVTVLMSEALFWDIAGRSNTVYTAFITGKPMVIQSTEGYDLRDLAHIDLILGLIHQSLLKRGIDITSLVE
ncbi:MAG: hypothetical protein ABIH46_11630 [Chloroflexota bacterium]